MNWQFSTYVIPLIFSTLILTGLGLFALRKRPASFALPYAGLMLATAFWSLTYALELSTANFQLKLLLTKLQYIGIVCTPLAWLIFAIDYSGYKSWVSRYKLALLGIAPAITIGLVWTNEYHGLIWPKVWSDGSLGIQVLAVTHGLWFWIHTLVSFSYLFIGTILLLGALLHSSRLYRGQILSVVMGALISWAGNFLTIFGFNPFPLLDITPFSFAIAGLVMGWGLFRLGFLENNPIARSSIVESMNDGVLVIDLRGRVIDVNLAACQILDKATYEVLGQPIVNLLTGWPQEPEIDKIIELELSFGDNENAQDYALQITPLFDSRGRRAGQVAIMRDMSERKQAERLIQQERDLSSRRSAQLAAVAQVARSAAGIHVLEDLLTHSTHLIAEQFNFYHIGIFLLDEAGEDAILLASNSPGGQKMLARQHRLKVGRTGIVGYVAKTGQPRIALDVGKDAVYFDNPDLPQTRSEIALPLKVREQIIGVLDVQSIEPGAFSGEDIEILQVLADQIALAIDNTRLLDESRQALRELENTYRSMVASAWRERLTDRPLAFQLDHSLVRPIQRETSAYAFATGSGSGKTMELPLELRGQKLGVLRLKRPPDAGDWRPEEQFLLKELASQITLALENARLLEQTAERAAREQLINQLTSSISRSLDLESLLQTTARELAQLPQVTEVSVHVAAPGPSD
jgi:PAS domain S-box-containing protein